MTEHFDVIVAGGGLVGATFAATLAGSPQWGALKLAIVDRQFDQGVQQDEPFDPRVVALTEASRQLLYSAGIWSDEVTARASPYGHMEVRDGQGTGLIEFDCGDVHRPNLGHIVENSVIVSSAHKRLTGISQVCKISSGVTDLTVGGDSGTTLLLGNGQRISAPLVVAADGANSLIRQKAGFNLRTWEYGHTAMVATINTSHSHNRTAYQWFSDTGPLAFLPLVDEQGDCHHCSIVWSQLPDVNKKLMALDEADFCRALTRASEQRLGEINSVSKRYCFPLVQRHVTDYVQQGVVLIGDAAHTIHPLAGQGVNLGFADVTTLVEEILRGLERELPVGHPSALARFQRRRKPDNLAMMALMESFKRVFAVDDPVVRIARNRGMSVLNRVTPIKNQLVRKAMGF